MTQLAPATTSRTSTCPVHSHNHWSLLEEVIVGVPYHLDYHTDESFRLFFHSNVRHNWWVFGTSKPDNRIRDESLEDLALFIELLEAEGVRVRRPQILDEVRVIRTPAWEAPMGHAMMPRDVFIVIGDEIIETAPMVRARYFEGDLYRDLFNEYFRAGARWTVAPKSRLLPESFDYSYVLRNGYTGTVPERANYEIMFDGAQIIRLGDTLLFNWSTENHRLGSRWLQRHLGDAYRLVEFSVADGHVDGLVVPLRPGWLLLDTRIDVRDLPPQIQRWNVIWFDPSSAAPDAPATDARYLASASIGMNVLSLDEERVVVPDVQHKLMHDLEAAGFTPLPCRWRHGRALGGGFHCMTLDVRRQSVLESYFD